MTRGERLARLALFAALAATLYAPAVHGPFVSDDLGYLVANPYTEELSLASLAAIADPRGPALHYTGNYAPVHLALSALERRLFGDAPFGYHAVNVALHALNAWLLVALLARAGVGRAGALLGGLLFLAHPANVEAVAWASQLKSVAALAFALGAWLALERRPAWATALFALALGTKAHALFLLPTAVAWLWLRRASAPAPTAGPAPAAWRWLVVWALLALAYAPVQLGAFAHLGAMDAPAETDLALRLRSAFAWAARYALIASTSLGVSAFHEPAPPLRWLDPRWLAGLALCVAAAARALFTLRARRAEAAFWVAAAAAFAPVSQLWPGSTFLSPIADRYLYFLLPGLVGAGACALDPPLARAAPRVRRAAAAAGVVAIALFAAHALERARLWRGEVWLLRDAALHYPDGGSAALLAARRAAQQGDPAAAIAALRRATERGFDHAEGLAADPGLAPLRGDPAFEALLDELARRLATRIDAHAAAGQPELRALAFARLRLGERARAIDALERALAAGGPWDAKIRAELDALRAAPAD